MDSITLAVSGQTIVPTGCAFSEYSGATKILPSWKRGISNRTTRLVTLADATLGHPNGYEVHDDLIIHVGWGDGFGVTRLNNDGTLTNLFGTTTPNSPTSTGIYFTAVAIHKASMKAVVMSYNAYGYSIWDYSACFTGGVATQDETGVNIFSTGVNIDKAALAHESGMVMAGDWLYVGDYDATHYKTYPRRNIVTDAEELLDGTALVDRNGYRYNLNYDEVNDRVFYFATVGGSFAVIDNASAVTPTIVWCDMGDAGEGANATETGLFIPDPVGAPNVMYVGAQYGHIKIDISPCVAVTGSPTILGSRFSSLDAANGQNWPIQFRAGTKYQRSTDNGEAHDKMLNHTTDFIPTSSDRAWNSYDGWLDLENERPVGLYYYEASLKEDTTTGGRGRSYRTQYSSPVFAMYSGGNILLTGTIDATASTAVVGVGTLFTTELVVGDDILVSGETREVATITDALNLTVTVAFTDTANDTSPEKVEAVTKHWIKLGYGWDGHGIQSWPDSVGPGLIGNWDVVFGPYAASEANIDFVALAGADFLVPSACSMTYFVSNDNGVSWEAYDYANRNTTQHFFASAGTQLKIKFVAIGLEHKAPYYQSQTPIGAVFGQIYQSEKTPTADLRSKVTRNRKRNRNI